MKVGLFIPCYINQLYSKVAMATLKQLKKTGIEVHFSIKQLVVANLWPIQVIAI